LSYGRSFVVRNYEFIGKAVPRVDGVPKVTGQARYAGDVSVPGMLWGKALRSPYAHARILKVDTNAARQLPGVHAVITGEDVAGHFYGRTLRDIPPLARDRVRHVGERVAAVAADDEDIAESALDLIEVEYEELPAVFDPLDAMHPDAPILHPDFNTYKGIREPLAAPSNAYVRTSFSKGDIEQGFAQADLIMEHTYRTQTNHGATMEPQAVVCWHEAASGRAHVWACTKVPYRVKEPVASTFGVSEEELVIHSTYVGGDFGTKSTPVNLPIAYFLSKACGRPVKMVSDYTEELLAGNPNQMMVYRLKTGIKRDGRITAHSVEHFANCGAYGGYKPGGAMGSANAAAGPYKVDNVTIESTNVYTNTLPGQIMRAPGEPQAIFALESHIDELALAIEMDPVEFRLRNLIESGEEMAAGEKLDDVRVKQTLRAAVDASGYADPKPPHVGRGVAVADRSQGGGQATVSFTVKPDGNLVIGAPVFDQGTGAYTTYFQVVSEELGVHFNKVELDVWDTDSVVFDAGLGGSIQSRLSSTVAYEAAQDLRAAIVSFVAARTGWAEDQLRLQGEEVLNTGLEEKANWRELLRQGDEPITGRAHINETTRGHFTAFATQIAEVSVDPQTGEIKLLKLTSAHDTGQVLNAIGHQGQINGGVAHGIGFGLMEELNAEDGRVTSGSLGDYKIPTVQDMPDLRTVLLEPSELGSGPYRVKGIGELPMVPTAAAIANAVADAVGIRIRDLPVTAEKVYEQLKVKP
jgi:CO/xanthine dehydrogenase Mo-binding subunit